MAAEVHPLPNNHRKREERGDDRRDEREERRVTSTNPPQWPVYPRPSDIEFVRNALLHRPPKEEK